MIRRLIGDITLKARIYNGMTKIMIRRLLALRLHFRIIGRVPSNDVKVQTQSKKTFNHELGAYEGDGAWGGFWEKIDGVLDMI